MHRQGVLNSDSTLDCRHPLSGENHYQYFQRTFFLFCHGSRTTLQSSHSRYLFHKDMSNFSISQIFSVFFLPCVFFSIAIHIGSCCHLQFLICNLNCFHLFVILQRLLSHKVTNYFLISNMSKNKKPTS